MTKLDLQYDLVNYTPASATPPQANFARVEQHINQELIERDGTVSMKAQLKLVGDPVNALDAAPKQYVDQVLPVGIIMMYGGAATPPGGRWALANGAELQSSEYPELFAVLGTAYVVGTPAAGRFNLPNLTDRFARGGAPGTTGGQADAPVVTHTHPIDHTHPGVGTGGASADHGHNVNINSGGFSENHYHMNQFGTYIRYEPGDPQFYLAVTGGGGFDLAGKLVDSAGISTNWSVQNHIHNVNGNTYGASADHYHGVNVPGFSGASAAPAAAVAATNANLPPYTGVTHIIRVR